MFSKGKKSDNSPETEPVQENRDKSPGSVDLASLDSHQPMYRKRENKPGQIKEKRIIAKRSNSPSAHQRPSRSSKRSSGKPTSRNDRSRSPSSTRSSQSNASSKKKTKKQTKVKKKKKSKLAIWFCMSTNTDTLDRDADPRAPLAKPSKHRPSIDELKSESDKIEQEVVDSHRRVPDNIQSQDASEETPPEILATKHSRRHHAGKRYSAPACSDWTTVVTKATVENENPSHTRPRSRTPTRGVRYRFDGTLEKPYVYPGGLTFGSGERIKRDDDKVFLDQSSFCDTTMDERSHFESYEEYDEFDVRKKFYLRYDSPVMQDSEPHDRRNSMPADFAVGERREYTLQNTHFRNQEETVVVQPFSNTNAVQQASPRSEIYDTPYESDNDLEKSEVREENSEKRNSYYSTPLQNSGCVYMWHSCEDLQYCGERYHSKEAVNRICPNCPNEEEMSCNNHTVTQCKRESAEFSSPEDQRNQSFPTTSYDRDLVEYPRKMSLPVELNFDHTGSNNIHEKIHRRENHIDRPTSHGDGHSGTTEHGDVTDSRKVRSDSSSSEASNPFRRNAVRSSCMPGNKRFFLPPPPCYTPPKEEMEAVLPLMSRDKYSCHRGSQTDLADDAGVEDMKDRDHSLRREEHLQDTNKPQQQQQSMRLDVGMTISIGHATCEAMSVQNPIHHQFVERSNSDSVVPSRAASAQNNDKSRPENQNQNSERSHEAKRSQSALTSTPKVVRRLELLTDERKVHTTPRPVPRPRTRNQNSVSSSFTLPSVDANNTNDTQHVPQGDAKDLPEQTKSSPVALRVSKTPPVPKKRRSQMIESDFNYTSADIANGLQSCEEIPSVNSLPINEEEITSSNDQKCVNQIQESSLRDEDVKNIESINATSVKVKDSISELFLPLQDSNDPLTAENSQPVQSPSDIQCRLCRQNHSHAHHGLGRRVPHVISPSIDAVLDDFRRMKYDEYDSDNDDNCNADDESSVHNEEIQIAKSTSVQNLLRARSIFDRSLAVTRKRRQRLRDRKCLSQLLSSAEYDDCLSANHMWRHHKCVVPENRLHGPVPPGNGNGNDNGREIPSNGIIKPRPELSKLKSVWQHSYTDSGNDSDMMSPTDTKGQPGVEELFDDAFVPLPSPWKKRTSCDYTRGTVEKKPWEIRLKKKQELRKSRSIEHLNIFSEKEPEVVPVVPKPSVETCV